jgi:hypothetical protein
MFTMLEPNLLKITKQATKSIEAAWESFKTTIIRRADPLPRHAGAVRMAWASPPMILSLPNSLPYLRQVLSEARATIRVDVPRNAGPPRLPDDFNPSNVVPKAMGAFILQYRSLSEQELNIENSTRPVPNSFPTCEVQCLELATDIGNYLENVGDRYDGNPEQNSVMLMTAVEMWMSMDERAVKLFPLMKDYNPGLPPDSLVRAFTPGKGTTHTPKSLWICS